MTVDANRMGVDADRMGVDVSKMAVDVDRMGVDADRMSVDVSRMGVDVIGQRPDGHKPPLCVPGRSLIVPGQVPGIGRQTHFPLTLVGNLFYS
jgi:hypothetical protein